MAQENCSVDGCTEVWQVMLRSGQYCRMHGVDIYDQMLGSMVKAAELSPDTADSIYQNNILPTLDKRNGLQERDLKARRIAADNKRHLASPMWRAEHPEMAAFLSEHNR
jgi:hypothetical protein